MEQALVVSRQELDAMIDEKVNAAIVRFTKTTKEDSNAPTFIYGIKGLAAFLNVSMVTAQKYKNESLAFSADGRLSSNPMKSLPGCQKKGAYNPKFNQYGNTWNKQHPMSKIGNGSDAGNKARFGHLQDL